MAGRLLGLLIDYEVGAKETTQGIETMITLRINSNSGAKAAEEPYVSDYGDILDTFLNNSESNHLSDDQCRKQEFVV
jgi:hypothetical protein